MGGQSLVLYIKVMIIKGLLRQDMECGRVVCVICSQSHWVLVPLHSHFARVSYLLVQNVGH